MKAINNTYIIKATLSLLLLLCANTVWGQDKVTQKVFTAAGFNHKTGDYLDKAKAAKEDGKLSLSNDEISKRFDLKDNRQQTHEYEQTLYLKQGKWLEIKPIEFSNKKYELGYARFYVWEPENTTQTQNLKEGLGVSNDRDVDNGYDSYRTIELEKNSYEDGVIVLDFKNQANYHVYYCWDGSTKDIAIDFSSSDDVAISLNGKNNAIKLDKINEPTLAYRYILHIKSCDEYTPQTFKYTATAGMLFQTKLGITSRSLYLERINNNGEDKGDFLNINSDNIDVTVDDEGGKYNSGSAFIENEMLRINNPQEGVYKVVLKYDKEGNGSKDDLLETYYITFLPLEQAGMLLRKDLADEKYKFQSPEYLDDETLFRKQASIDFDNYSLIERENVRMYHKYDKEQDKDLYDDKDIMCSPIPLQWEESSYTYFPEGDWQTYTITNITDYVSWRSDKVYHNPVYDVKYYDNGCKGGGNFIYVNASNQPGKLLSLNWDYSNVCPQSRIYVSGWVNEVSDDVETANLAIKLIGVKDDGSEDILNTYITGYVPGKQSPNDDTRGKHPLYNTDMEQYTGEWYHIYYSFIPDVSEGTPSYNDYKLVIENNAASSSGADFLLDDFRLYTDITKVRTNQISTECNNTTTIRISREFSNIADGESNTLHYAIYNESGRLVPNSEGKIVYDKVYKNNPELDKVTKEDEIGRFTEGAAEYIGFYKKLHFGIKGQTDPSDKSLENRDEENVYVKPGQLYYMVFGSETELSEEYDVKNPEVCATYCTFVVNSNVRPEIDGIEDDGSTQSYCFGSNKFVTVNMYDKKGEAVSGVMFDWYFGSMPDFKADKGLYTAIQNFRKAYPDKTEIDESVVEEGGLTEAQITMLREKVAAGKVALAKSNGHFVQLGKKYTYVVVMPTDQYASDYCPDPAEFVIEATNSSPNLTVGFREVKYPNGIDKTIRIGMEYLKKAIRVPVCDPNTNDVNGIAHTAVIINDKEDNGIYLYDTNDPDMKQRISKGAQEVGESDINVGKTDDHINITFDYNGNEYTPDMREGYKYYFYCRIQAEESEGATPSACNKNMLLFAISVVPEFQKWIGGKDGNWNNDDNWERSSGKDIHKTGLEEDPDKGGTRNSFVPMNFTKVVIPNGKQVRLYNPNFVGTTHGNLLAINDKVTNAKGETVNVNTSTGVGDATPYIEYEIMADAIVTNNNGEEWVQCRPYYTNTVAQIHFEPGAEMLNSGLLTHEKAWVDYEIEPKQWYALATPLQGVVAGDWYAPTDNGRQETEYYKDITFDESTNSRVKPAVYQRGWKGNTTMYMSSTDGDTKSVAVKGNWSAMYNDVNVAYTPGSGFSLKATDAPKGNLLFRLPKADTEYYYYTYNNGSADKDGNSKKTINRSTDAGKLNQISGTEEFTVPLKNNGGNYYLVGNPFMAHLNMTEFFNKNGDLTGTYWLEEAGSQTTGKTEGSIEPLRSFFVEKKTTGASEGDDTNDNSFSVKFTNEMQVLGSSTTSEGGSGAKLHISAVTDDGRTSNAIVCYSDEASADYDESEDAMLFVDSNLGDLPMVYTVGGDRALAVNSTPATRVPLNVYGQDDNDVTLRFSNIPEGTDLCLYDAASRTATPLTEGYEVAVRTNDNGRYYLTGSTTGIGEAAATDGSTIAIWSARSGELTVATTATALRDVKVYDMAGTLAANSDASNRNSITLTVPAGNVYIVTATDSNGTRRTAKVMVF